MSLESWQRQPNESAKAYEAARIYFEMGVERSLEAVGQRLVKSRSFLSRWSARWGWVERAKDYDAAEFVKRQLAIDRANEAEATKWAKRQAQIREDGFATYLALKAKAEEMLRFPLARIEKRDGDKTTIVHPADWSFNTAVRMQETALKLGRLSADLSTENIDIKSIPWDELSIDEVERIGAGESVAAVLRDYRARKAAIA